MRARLSAQGMMSSFVLCFAYSVMGQPAQLAAEVITLKSGVRIEGSVGKVSGLDGDPLKGAAGGEVATKEIVIIDDDLRRVFVGQKNVHTLGESQITAFEKIRLQQAVASAGPGIASVGPIVRVTPFDKYGRRIFTMAGAKGNIDVIQGITEITPRYTKVEALTRGSYQYVWSMRIATSSIPRDTLSEILMHRIDPKNPEQRLSIVKLYTQAQRIQDARAELEQVISDFPDLSDLDAQVGRLRILGLNMLLKEVQLRRDAGQHQLAVNMLTNFPDVADGGAGVLKLEARDKLAEYEEIKAKGEKSLALMTEHLGKIENEATRQRATEICKEIAAEMNIHSLDRMADYLRLSDDPNYSAEQKLSLAISGWLLGSGNGTDNLAGALSLVQVRQLVREYLLSKRQPERDAALAALTSLEGSTSDYIAKLIAHMKPPMATFAQAPGAAAPPPVPEKLAEPAAAAANPMPMPPAQPAAPPADGGLLDRELKPVVPQVAPNKPVEPAPADHRDGSPVGVLPVFNDTPGLLKLATPGLEGHPMIEYFVQLPPEYDPYRRYPCVVTLNGAGTTPVQQIDWWAGPYNKKAGMRYGQATRHGYIVIAPVWAREHQREYEYSLREHSIVVRALRDAYRRFSIDTDRVFLSGHSMGGDAAWDIAGVIPIVARADKYIPRYSENGRNLPMYFVAGEKDGDKWFVNAPDWERYLKYVGYDTMVVQFQGRGHEHFHDEIQNLFDWMNLHRRNFFPKKFLANSMRLWDNYFWFVEADMRSKGAERSMVAPVQWPPERGTLAAKVEGTILPNNGVSADSSAEKITLWLSPEMIDFNAKPFVILRGKRIINGLQPDIAVLLEDVRTRSDRQHPFWAKVSN
jgi:hypothetical protein